MSEYKLMSKYQFKPLVRCFGSWRQVAYGLTQFAEGRGLAEQWKAELELAAVKGGDQDAQWMLSREAPTARSKMLAALKERALTAGPTAGATYGPPMWPGPLAYAPMNELGVVFLFGWMAPQLGYVVHRIQPEFPDCEAMRLVGEDRCELVKAEFEYESRNFLKHMHDVKGCNMIICWRHNWPECPLEVLELKSLLPKLQDYQTSYLPSAEESCNSKSWKRFNRKTKTKYLLPCSPSPHGDCFLQERYSAAGHGFLC